MKQGILYTLFITGLVLLYPYSSSADTVIGNAKLNGTILLPAGKHLDNGRMPERWIRDPDRNAESKLKRFYSTGREGTNPFDRVDVRDDIGGFGSDADSSTGSSLCPGLTNVLTPYDLVSLDFDILNCELKNLAGGGAMFIFNNGAEFMLGDNVGYTLDTGGFSPYGTEITVTVTKTASGEKWKVKFKADAVGVTILSVTKL